MARILSPLQSQSSAHAIDSASASIAASRAISSGVRGASADSAGVSVMVFIGEWGPVRKAIWLALLEPQRAFLRPSYASFAASTADLPAACIGHTRCPQHHDASMPRRCATPEKHDVRSSGSSPASAASRAACQTAASPLIVPPRVSPAQRLQKHLRSRTARRDGTARPGLALRRRRGPYMRLHVQRDDAARYPAAAQLVPGLRMRRED
jgi:hypothetical protein